MPRFARIRILVVTLLASVSAVPVLASGDGAVSSRLSTTASYILIGFAGGFVRHDDLRHGPVRLAQKIQKELPSGATVEVFENRHRKAAFEAILHLLDRNHDGSLSDAEKLQARIILFGHSWGASAAVLLSRDLDRVGIPVLLTVQVDSVAKPWQDDRVIPDNVAAAVNFYQPHGPVHGRARIVAANHSKTEILGNYQFDYHKTPVRCDGGSWLQRTFTRDHLQSQCDPRLWTQVEGLMLQRIDSQPSIVAALPLQ